MDKILQQDPAVATGAEHHSVVHTPDDQYYMVYHRRPLDETDGNSRVTCIDRMTFDKNGAHANQKPVPARWVYPGKAAFSYPCKKNGIFDPEEPHIVNRLANSIHRMIK